jgi:RNA polymerase sigma-70 factor (ECF subfamily)
MGTSLRAWLFTILRNIYYSQYRKRSREVQDSDGVYSRGIAVEGDQESHLDLVDFRKALAKLPAEQREVLMMVGASGLSYEEAAAICGVEIGTIKSRLSRARTRLGELLALNERRKSQSNRELVAASGPLGADDPTDSD